MATKKASKKQEVKTTTRGNSYELTAAGRKALDTNNLKGQQLIIMKEFEKIAPATVAQVAAKVEGKLETKQEAGRVVGFYFVQWKRDGLLKFAAKPKAEKKSKKAEQAAEVAA